MSKLFKKTVAVILCIVIMLGIAPLNGFVGLEFPEIHLPRFSLFETKASAVEYYESGYLKYYITTDGYAYIDSYIFNNWNGGSVYIPGYLSGYPTKVNTSLGLFTNTNTTFISVGDGCSNASSDNQGALYNKDKTTLIRLPKATSLTYFIIPDTVVSTYGGSCSECQSLKKVYIPASLTKPASGGTFNNCNNLSEVVFDSNITKIPYCRM